MHCGKVAHYTPVITNQNPQTLGSSGLSVIKRLCIASSMYLSLASAIYSSHFTVLLRILCHQAAMKAALLNCPSGHFHCRLVFLQPGEVETNVVLSQAWAPAILGTKAPFTQIQAADTSRHLCAIYSIIHTHFGDCTGQKQLGQEIIQMQSWPL